MEDGGASMTEWRENLIDDDARIRELLGTVKRMAVLGIKTEAQAEQAAFYVPAFLARAGVEIVPVPVYYPEVKSILGRPVFRSVAEIPGPVDLVDVFRRPADVAAHLPDLLAKRPKAVWLQLGIRDDASAEVLAKAGILVVQDRCLKVDWARLGPR
jgi:predicted CoA-binding protein